MNYNTLQYPIPYNRTWDVVDSTKTEEMMQCWRKYFWRYLLGYETDTPKQDLVFGDAWHKALEHLFLTDYSNENVQIAFNEHFMPTYRAQFPLDTDAQYGPKTPDIALKTLLHYVDHYQVRDDHQRYEILHVEVAGNVLISEDRVMAFRMDCIARERSTGKVIGFENKTTKRAGAQWAAQWTLANQIMVYSHALNCMYGSENTKGLIINGAYFYTAGSKLERCGRVPMFKTPDMLRAGLSNINVWLDQLDDEMLFLSEAKDSDPVLMAFPMNPKSCTNYGICPYLDFCATWPNPLQRLDFERPPFGFRIRFWDPGDRDAKVKVGTLGADARQKVLEDLR